MVELSSLSAHIPFWNDLTEAQKQTVRHHVIFQHYATDTLLRSGDLSCLGMVVILSGGIRVSVLSEEGREVLLFHLTEGETCVFSASCVLHAITLETQITTDKDTDVLILNAGAFNRLIETNLSVKCFTYELAVKRFSTALQVFQQILFDRFDRRLAAFLLTQAENENSNVLHLTQAQIAAEINSAREVVARTLKQFADNGLIENKRGTVVLKNKARLKTLC